MEANIQHLARSDTFYAISLDENAIETIAVHPIPEAPDSNQHGLSQPFLRGSYERSSDTSSKALPPSPKSNNLNWLCRKPCIFPLAYCWVTPMIWILSIFSGMFHGHMNILVPYPVQGAYLSLQACYFATFSQLSAILFAITGYFRFCQLDYYLEAASQKTNDRIYSLTADFRRNAPRILQNDLSEIAKFKKYNSRSLKLCYFAAFSFVLAGNFRFYSTPIIYLISFIAFALAAISYCEYTIKIIKFLSRKFKYESQPNSMFVIIIFGSVTIGLYIAILIALTTFITIDRDLSSGELMKTTSYKNLNLFTTILEWITNFSFPVFTVCTYRRMRDFPNWENVNLNFF